MKASQSFEQPSQIRLFSANVASFGNLHSVSERPQSSQARAINMMQSFQSSEGVKQADESGAINNKSTSYSLSSSRVPLLSQNT